MSKPELRFNMTATVTCMEANDLIGSPECLRCFEIRIKNKEDFCPKFIRGLETQGAYTCFNRMMIVMEKHKEEIL